MRGATCAGLLVAQDGDARLVELDVRAAVEPGGDEHGDVLVFRQLAVAETVVQHGDVALEDRLLVRLPARRHDGVGHGSDDELERLSSLDALGEDVVAEDPGGAGVLSRDAEQVVEAGTDLLVRVRDVSVDRLDERLGRIDPVGFIRGSGHAIAPISVVFTGVN